MVVPSWAVEPTSAVTTTPLLCRSANHQHAKNVKGIIMKN
eukprot:CAMPEP_0113307078 /NCGR_PEP_ID=MMETSP0010_2-20120614/6075_1 /TAXON_ID=216773 ORGANISM="Corethron hystrix, Strain 308" /NCGR_SAMPLE_ID=MMETSP0010_2 /ASSEMBLY_ACC=CAM_ASM_000155 /LENGTH=39 /DNA_ID=CAMNT_0000161877 /DNA_START=161 /DNA_END=280 /DNA_ORIENTATION=+ /assembly_acc=CAM_ASM_000155